MTVGQVIAKLGLDPKEYEKGLRKAETQANKAGSKIGSIFKNAFSVTLGQAMFESLKKGFKSTVGTAISFNSMIQTAQIGFATMLGSAEKAQKFLDDMADFAARTPFEYPELLEAAKRMLAYGFAAEEVLPTLRAVGDASAALGSGSVGIDRITLALGQIQAKGKLSGEEMRQLTEAGIPAWHILAEAMGKTVPELQDMVSKGLVPGAKAVDMLTAGMTKRFGGMMASMEDTWQGVTSSIRHLENDRWHANTKPVRWTKCHAHKGKRFPRSVLQHVAGCNGKKGAADHGWTCGEYKRPGCGYVRRWRSYRRSRKKSKEKHSGFR